MKEETQGREHNRGWRMALLATAFVSIIWFVICIPAILGFAKERSLFDFGMGDFNSLYMSAVAAGEHRWDLLYPPDFRKDKPTHSPPANEMTAMLQTRKCPVGYAYVYPPPATVFFLPLSYCDFPKAKSVWLFLNWACLAALLFFVCSDCRELGLDYRYGITFPFLFGMTYPAWTCMKSLNLPFLFALLMGLAFRDIRRRKNFLPALASVFMGATKGFSAVWIPLFLLWKRFGVLLWGVALSALLMILCFAAGCRIDSYVRFFTDVVPAMKMYVAPTSFNEGISVLLLSAGSSASCSILFANVFLFCSLAVVYVWEWRYGDSTDRLRVSLLLSISFLCFQLANNVCWLHYRVHLMAFAPTLLACCGNHVMLRRIAFWTLAANFLFVPHFLVKLIRLFGWSDIPACLSHSGAIGQLILFGVMFVVLRSRERDHVSTHPVLLRNTTDDLVVAQSGQNSEIDSPR